MNLSVYPHPVIFFDGVCNVCTGTVQFVIRRDPKQYFRFASLQSDTGQQLLEELHLPKEEWGSFILWDRGRMYTKSTGVLRVAQKLSGLWPLLSVFLIIPPFIRDAVYDLVARNRYRWFGKKTSCWMPTPELEQLFLDKS
ncbi:MAG: DUF393 domain-containing protein [Bacteroidota bacterium]|nr:DUF393 domain-containing protein [Bacteroidota bacterium]